MQKGLSFQDVENEAALKRVKTTIDNLCVEMHSANILWKSDASIELLESFLCMSAKTF